MRLAELWRMPLREVRATLAEDPVELALWMAYAERCGPWWGERFDVLNAMNCSTTAAAAGVKNVRGKEFLPDWSADKHVEQLPWADAAAILIARYVGPSPPPAT